MNPTKYYSEGIWIGTGQLTGQDNLVAIIKIHRDYEVGDDFESTNFMLNYHKLAIGENLAGLPSDHKVAPAELSMWKDT